MCCVPFCDQFFPERETGLIAQLSWQHISSSTYICVTAASQFQENMQEKHKGNTLDIRAKSSTSVSWHHCTNGTNLIYSYEELTRFWATHI